MYTWKTVLICSLALFVFGCGGSNSLAFDGTPAVNQGGVQQTFVGQFIGANAINNQNAVLNVNTFTSGQAAGTLQVLAPGVVQQGSLIPVGLYDAAGTFDPVNGGFTLSGNIPGIGPFTITGNLPTGNNQGSYRLSLGGQNFNGVIQNAKLGTPAVPNDDDDDNPNTGDSRQIFGGTFSNFVFTPDGAYNGVDPPVTENSPLTGIYTENSPGSNLTTLILSELGANTRSLTVSIITQDGRPVNVGQTYNLVTDPNEDGAIVTLNESTGTTVTRGWSQVAGTTGQMTVISVNGSNIEVAFEFNNLGPNPEIDGNTATGGFSVEGRVLANFVSLGGN